MSYFSIHNHTDYSNIRLLDAINKPKDLINKAIEYNLKGICITDHELLSGHVDFLGYYNKIKSTNPNFKIGLGNEIYLVEQRKNKQKYYHFLLLAKNDTGHRALRELSSLAWCNSYFDRGMERVPTLYEELETIVQKYPNSLIASTACLGGFLPQAVLSLLQYEKNPLLYSDDIANTKESIQQFILFMLKLFKDDFYIEVAPSKSKVQKDYNQKVVSIAKAFNIKIVFATDSHFLTEKDRLIHKSYLNAQEGDREIDDFYQYCYLMNDQEARDLLSYSYEDQIFINSLFENTLDIYNKIEEYTIFQSPIIPVETVLIYPQENHSELNSYPHFKTMMESENDQNRYWANTCLNKLHELNLHNDLYLKRLDIESEVITYISDKLNQSLAAYFNTMQSYINLFWDSGSIVGPGRGSAVGFLSNFLLGITQIDPIKYDLPWFRFLNKERAELPKQYWAA